MDKKINKKINFVQRLDEILNRENTGNIFKIVEKEKNFSKKYYISSDFNNTKGILERFNLNENYQVFVLNVTGKEEIYLPINKENVIGIIYCFEGRSSIFAENEKEYLLKKGDIVIYGMNNDKNYKYKIKSNNLKNILFFLNIDKLEQSLSKSVNRKILYNWTKKVSKILKEYRFSYIKKNSKVEILLNQIEHMATIENINDYILFETKIVQFIFKILELQINIPKNSINSDSIVVEEIKILLYRYPVSEIPTIKELSEIIGLSNYQLQRIFKKVENVTIFQYIQKIKMRYAKMLLEANDGRTILDISNEIGYENPSKFSAVFKKHFGILPNKYKKQKF